ncbi:MAG: hypothetical protein D6748_07545, partial [Calditrichaeota bacterium]
MSWRSKLEQLIGLIEKVPQPRTFKTRIGVYEPYFVIELRASNWELIPYASYTRLDGSSGREVRLSLSLVDSSKVEISQNELNCLLFLESDSSPNSRAIFSYTQPVGFLLEWLSESRIMVRETNQETPQRVTVHPETSQIIMRLKRTKKGYALQPSLLFPDGKILEINNPAIVLTSNPIYLLYGKVIYQINSALPAIFWNNYFRIWDQFDIPFSELDDFVRIYLPHLFPILDWENLGDTIVKQTPPLTSKEIVFSEINNHLQIDVYFHYDKFRFMAYPAVDKSLTTVGKNLHIIQRQLEEEDRARKFLEENGLLYSGGNWHIAADYHYLDWMRLVVPKLKKAGFVITGEEKLRRYRVYRQPPRLDIRVRSGVNWIDVDYQIAVGKEIVKIPQLLPQLKDYKGYIKLANGAHIYVDESLRDQLLTFANFLEFKTGEGSLHLPQAGVAMLHALQGLNATLHLDKKSQELLEKYNAFQKIRPVTPPNTLQGTLREYQQHGLNWLCFLKDFYFGGILADD